METDKRIDIMANAKPVNAILKMGIPVTMGMLFMVVYNLVDTYFIGLLHDDYQLAACNLAYPVMMIMVAVSSIVGNGGASYIARCIGAKKEKEANHTLTIGFELIGICSLIITVFGFIFIQSIVQMLGAKEYTFEYTKQYVMVMLAGSIFTMGNYAVGQLLRSEGSTFYSMVGMIAGTIANIILDPIFIFTFHLQIQGAAIATVIGNAIGLMIFTYYYLSKKTYLHPSIHLLHLDLSIIKEIMVVGIPHTLEQLFATMAIVVSNNLASNYGELTVAAMGISNKVISFGSYIYQGFAAGAQPLMGYNYGAKNFARMKQLIWAGIGVICCIEICIMILLGIFAPVLIGIFSTSEEVIRIGAMTLRASMLMLPFVGGTSMVRNTYNSMGKAMYSFGITFVRQLILYIPFLLIFNYIWGYIGLIHAQPLEELVCMIFSILLLLHSLKKFEKEK